MEWYINDPILKSTVRVVLSDSWYAFLADGAELVADTLDALMEDLRDYWMGVLRREVAK